MTADGINSIYIVLVVQIIRRVLVPPEILLRTPFAFKDKKSDKFDILIVRLLYQQ